MAYVVEWVRPFQPEQRPRRSIDASPRSACTTRSRTRSWALLRSPSWCRPVRTLCQRTGAIAEALAPSAAVIVSQWNSGGGPGDNALQARCVGYLWDSSEAGSWVFRLLSPLSVSFLLFASCWTVLFSLIYVLSMFLS